VTEEAAPSQRIAAALRERIAREGAIPLPVFMMEALFDPVAGYYATKDPIGAGADFITAPEISQMFGELLGLWAAEAWAGLGAPSPVQLIELGPGKGTMMADMLRSGRAASGDATAQRRLYNSGRRKLPPAVHSGAFHAGRRGI
jgi:NADH dehydrogenase [ubiquinone] 1 alpha subcomplex assembly factor 7